MLPKPLICYALALTLLLAMSLPAELCAEPVLKELSREDIFAYPPKSSFRVTRWLRKADKFKTKGRIEKAVLYYIKAAERNDARGQYLLGLCYNEGYGVPSDGDKSLHWISLSAEQGYLPAQFFLGQVYFMRRWVGDDQKAFTYYREAALQGHTEAQYNVGWCYFSGFGVEPDNDEAFRWIRKSAEKGYSKAQEGMGLAYYFGDRGMEQDYKLAANWFERAAEQGELLSQFYLATLYFYGMGVEADTVKAFSWYKESAERGYMWSQNKMGDIYERGEGVEPDSSAAFLWYKKAAEPRSRWCAK